MSTSTGPAFVLKDGVDVFALGEHLDALRDAQELEIVQWFFKDTVLAFVGREHDKSFRDFVRSYLSEDVDFKNISGWSPYIGSLISSSFLFYKNPVRNEVVVRAVGLSGAALELFEQLPLFSREVTYYNGSDSQLDKISEEEWKDRKKVWDELDLRTAMHPQALHLSLFNEQYARYEFLNVKALEKHWDNLEFPAFSNQLRDVFVSMYTQSLTEAGEDALEVVSRCMFVFFDENNNYDLRDLYKGDEYAVEAELARQKALTRLAHREIVL